MAMQAASGPGGIISKSDDELVLVRIFDAPRELVYAIWTDPAHALAWWGPREHPAIHVAMDVRPGGAWSATLRSPDGREELTSSGIYHEVSPPDRLVFSFTWDRGPDGGRETLVALTFEDAGGKTRMTLRQAPFVSLSSRDGHGHGWWSCMDRLEDFIAARQRGA